MVPTSFIPWATDAATPSRLPPQTPVSFCFFTTAAAVLDSTMAARAASMDSGEA
jgi:hypothetical protein